MVLEAPVAPAASVLMEQLPLPDGHIEITHFPAVDLLMNRDARHAFLGSTLVEAFGEGIPSGWPALSEDDTNIFTGEIDGHELAAKLRCHVGGSDDLKTIRESKEKGFPVPRHLFAFNSVVNELSLAPRIKRLMQSREAQEAAVANGFKGVNYVEPIAAFIDKRTKQKGTVYERVDSPGASELAHPGTGRETVAYRLKGLLINFGVRPVDFKSEHLLVDAENWLRLVDAEAFYAYR